MGPCYRPCSCLNRQAALSGGSCAGPDAVMVLNAPLRQVAELKEADIPRSSRLAALERHLATRSEEVSREQGGRGHEDR